MLYAGDTSILKCTRSTDNIIAFHNGILQVIKILRALQQIQPLTKSN